MYRQAANKRRQGILVVAQISCLTLGGFLSLTQPAPSQAPTRTHKIRVFRGSAKIEHPSPSAPSGLSKIASTNPPTPAQIVFNNGTLLVQAYNSDLDQILTGVAQASGMVITGRATNTRVYGIYGPRDPTDVLTELLVGAGVNIMMVGRTQLGAPRELLLTAKGAGPSPPRASTAGAISKQIESGVTSDRNLSLPDGLGPGALPPGPPPPPQNQDERREQNLRRLQQMQDRQKTQNPQL